MPRVSVVIPTYNRAESVGDTVQSALNQTHDDLEVIVVDDGSTDETSSVLSNYETDPRVRIVRHETNRGISAARNSGIETADGEFICQLDDDDQWMPEKVEKQLECFEDLGEEYGVVYTGGIRYNNGQEVGRRVPKQRGNIYPEVLVRFRLNPHSGHMVRAEAYETVGGFDTDFDRAVDWDICIRLARTYKFGAVMDPLVKKYARPDGVETDDDHGPQICRLVWKKYREEFEAYPDIRRQFRAHWAGRRMKTALSQGAYLRATRELFRALQLDPTLSGVRSTLPAWIPYRQRRKLQLLRDRLVK